MSNHVGEFTLCANCGACQNACPQNAIYVDAEDLFYRVRVDENKCVACGLCKKVCPVNTPCNGQNLQSAYSAIHRDKKVVRKSSSGGVFSAVAEKVLEDGGVVYGAAYSEDRKQVVYKSTDAVALDDLRRSKYVESLVGNAFREIREQLESDRKVLFCGAPCQVAGLCRYLGKSYDNLITCDFSCGGFPGHGVFEQYLEALKQRLGGKTVTNVNFRPKDYGWQIHSISVTFDGKKKYKCPMHTDPYFHSFLMSGAAKRAYCYQCDFSDNHYADLILADFWMYGSLSDYPRVWDGLSLILSNSPKGDVVMKSLEDRMEIKSLDLEKGSYNIKKCEKDPARLEKRAEFLEDFKKNGIFKAAEHRGMPVGMAAKKQNIAATVAKIKNRVKAALKLR